jgi:hypothetical protein
MSAGTSIAPLSIGAARTCRLSLMALRRGGGFIMLTEYTERPPLEQPLAELERQLIRAYVAGAGWTLETLLARNDDEARKIHHDAMQYASTKLSEVEARSHYLRELHGEA